MFDASTLYEWITAVLALMSCLLLGLPAGAPDGGDGGDGGDPGDSGDGGDPGDMPDPAPGAWRGEAAPAAGQTPASGTPAGNSGQPAGDRNIPPADDATRRLQELERRNAELERNHNALGQQHRTLQRMLAQAAGVDGPREPQTPEDARRQRLLDQFFDLFPKDKQPMLRRMLLESPERFAALADQAPEFETQTSRHWQGVARQTTSRLHDAIAPLILGAGKKGSDIDAETRDDLREHFGRWIMRDKTGGRSDRYEMQDPELVTEFTNWFKARYIDPGRRAAATTVINRGDRTSRLPVGGGGGNPVRTPAPPPPDLEDDDAVHKRGWEVAQALKNGG